jgi:hypothetical protein
MSKDIFGYYDSPLSKEERTAAIELVDEKLKDDAREFFIYKLTELLYIPYHAHRFLFSAGQENEVKEYYYNKCNLIIIELQREHPEIKELENPELLLPVLTFNEDNTPVVGHTDLINRLDKGETKLTLILDNIPEWKLIQMANRVLEKQPDLRSVLSENGLIIAFNEKCNDLVDEGWGGNVTINFTDIIKDIIKQTKEGKL